MTRLRAYVHEGRLDLIEVLEMMVLINGLLQSGGWPVLAMALSTDETLSFSSMCDRLAQQADRLTGSKTHQSSIDRSYQHGSAKSITGGGNKPSIDKPQDKSRPPYWSGQQSRPTHQSSQHRQDDTESQSSRFKKQGKGKKYG